MSDDILHLAIEGGIASITFNRPAKLNAIDVALAGSLTPRLPASSR